MPSRWKACWMRSPSMSYGTLTAASARPELHRSMLWRSKSTVFPAAWSTRTGSLSVPPPVVTALWARTLPQMCEPSAASPRPLKMHRSFWRCAARYICHTRPFSTCAPSRNYRVLRPLKTPAMQQPDLCGKRTPASPAAVGFLSLCSMCSRSGARP